MNPNPVFGGAPATENAKDALSVPAILLLVSGALGALSGLSGMVMGAIRGGKVDPNLAKALAGLPEPTRENVMRMMESLQGPGSIVINLIALGLSGFVIFGALKMRSLQSHGVAVGASIVSLIPCFVGCCCIGMPAGLWALILLLKPEIKSQFQA